MVNFDWQTFDKELNTFLYKRIMIFKINMSLSRLLKSLITELFANRRLNRADKILTDLITDSTAVLQTKFTKV